MKRMFLERSSYLLKLVLSFSLLTVVIISLFGGYITNRVYNMLSEEIARESLQQLNKVKDFVEGNYLERYQLSVLNKALETIRMSSTDEIQYFLDHGSEGNYYRITKLVENLNTLTISSSGMRNVTIWFSESGFAVDQQYYYSEPDRSPNNKLISQIQKIPPHHWFVREVEQSDGSKEKLLTYIYTLPYLSASSQAKGYIIVDVAADDLANKLNELSVQGPDSLYVFTERGELAVTNASKDDWHGVFERLQSSAHNSFISSSYEKGRILASLPASDSKLGWTYAVVRPMDSSLLLTRNLQREVWLAALTVLLIGLALSLFLSLRTHKPIQLLMGKLNTLSRQSKQQQLQDILNGALSVNEEMLPIPNYAQYCVAVLTEESGNTETLRKQFELKQQYLKAAPVIIFGRVAILFFANADECQLDETIHKELEQFRCQLNGEAKFSAGIGCIVHDIEHIHFSYKEACEASDYRFIYGAETIVAYDRVRDRGPLSIDKLPGEAFASILQSGSAEQIRDVFTKLRNLPEYEKLSLQAIELLLNHVALTTAKMLSTLGESKVQFSAFDLLTTYRQTTLTETLDQIESLCLQAANHRNSRSESPHAAAANAVKSYIDQRLSEDIGLDELADSISYSKQFICKVFKDTYGITITEYMTKSRIDWAKTLLADDSLSISEIAKQTGYRSSNYFCTKFKQVCGITPLQFRSGSKQERNAL